MRNEGPIDLMTSTGKSRKWGREQTGAKIVKGNANSAFFKALQVFRMPSEDADKNTPSVTSTSSVLGHKLAAEMADKMRLARAGSRNWAGGEVDGDIVERNSRHDPAPGLIDSGCNDKVDFTDSSGSSNAAMKEPGDKTYHTGLFHRSNASNPW